MWFFLQEQNGFLMPSEKRSLFFRFNNDCLLNGGQINSHEGERLLGAMLPISERLDGALVRGVAGEMEAADALDGDNFSINERTTRFCDSIRSFERCSKNGNFRAAVITADGLRVVAAGVRVVVFCRADIAHREGTHGCALAVVGSGGFDGEAGATVGAVDERVEVATVRGIVEFLGAGFAGSDVGGDVDGPWFVSAFDDLEIGEGHCVFREFFGLDVEDDGARRRFFFDGSEESHAGLTRSLRKDFDVRASVRDGAADVEAGGEAGDEGTEADALDDAGEGGAEYRHVVASFLL